MLHPSNISQSDQSRLGYAKDLEDLDVTYSEFFHLHQIKFYKFWQLSFGFHLIFLHYIGQVTEKCEKKKYPWSAVNAYIEPRWSLLQAMKN